MATNWNTILSNTKNLNDVLAILRKILSQTDKFSELDIDSVLANIDLKVQESINKFNSSQDDLIEDLNKVIAIAEAAGAGANGWTDSLISTGILDAITQRDVNRKTITTVNTVADLDKVQKIEGRTIYHKGYYAATNFALATPYKGGGIRVYVASRATENDGFLCINGWVLQLENPKVLNPLQAGAYADAVNDDQQAIQKCIAAAKASGTQTRVTIDDNYYVGSLASGMQFMFKVHSNLEISGSGSVSCLSGSTYSTDALALFGYADDARISDVTISDFIINGNKENVTSAPTAEESITGININNCTDPTIRHIKVRKMSGGGIYIRQALDVEKGALRGKVEWNTVNDVGFIGIQCRRPYNTTIANNIVYNTGDNCIDVEGVKANDIWNGYVQNLVISANNCQAGNNGIFLESIGKATVTGNHVTGCNYQLTMNFYSDNTQSYSKAKDILITGNTFDAGELINATGINSLYCGFWSCYANTFRNLKYSFSFIQTEGVVVGENTHVINQNSVYIFKIDKPKVSTTNLIWSKLSEQQVVLEKYDQDMPNFKYCSPLTNPSKIGIAPPVVLTISNGILNMKQAAIYDILKDEQYQYFSNKALSNGISDWGGAYSIYFNNQTRIAMNLSIPYEADKTEVGTCLLINDKYYQVTNKSLNKDNLYEICLTKFNQDTGNFEDSDFSNELNGSYSAVGYNLDWLKS